MDNSFSQSNVMSPTGATLNVFHMVPSRKPKAIVQINHGMAEHAGRYVRFANALADRGYATVAHDHRGHGETTAPDATQGFFGEPDGFGKVIGDVDAVSTFARELCPNTPVVCFGHSMGGLIAMVYALQHSQKVDGLAIWNIGTETGFLTAASRLIFAAQAMVFGRRAANNLAVKLTFATWNKVFKPNRTDFDWISRDTAEVDKYVADPMCGFAVSIGLWQDFMAALYFAANNRNLTALPPKLPVHLQGGDQDPVSVCGQASAELARRLTSSGMTDVRCEILADTRHESLNELNRDDTTLRFIDWLDQRY